MAGGAWARWRVVTGRGSVRRSRRASPLTQNLPEARQALADGVADGDPAAPGGQTALGQQLAGLPPAEQERMLTGMVRAEAAAVLGHPSPDAVDASWTFRDL